MVHVSNNGEGRHKLLTFSTPPATTTQTNSHNQTQASESSRHHNNHHPNHHLNTIINTVFEQNSKETTVGDLLLPNNKQHHLVQNQEESTVPLFPFYTKSNGLNLSCVIEEEPLTNNMMTSTNILRESSADNNEQQQQVPLNGNANLNLNLVTSTTTTSTIEDTTNSNTLNGNSNLFTQTNPNNNITTTTSTTCTTNVREDVSKNNKNGHGKRGGESGNGKEIIKTSKTTTTITSTSSSSKKSSSSSSSSKSQKEKVESTKKKGEKVSHQTQEELVESAEECDKVPLLSTSKKLSSESSSNKRKSPIKNTNETSSSNRGSTGENSFDSSTTTLPNTTNTSNISSTTTTVNVESQPAAVTTPSNVKQPSGRLTNGTKNPALKRVSFGSSKGSMVETHIYENPISEDRELVKTAGGNVSTGSPTTTGSTAGPSCVVTTILKTTETNDSIDSTLSGGSTGGSRPPSRVRVTFFESEKPLAVSSPESDIPDFDLSNMTLPGSPITNSYSTPNQNYHRQMSGEIGWENPFRPDGDLSKEADQIVELIKEGKPINDETLRSKSPSVNEVMNSTTYSFANAKPGTKGANGTTNGLEVQRGVVAQPNQPDQVELVNLKKKKKGCCVVQ